jgi:long-chain fatty acid transport protein
MGDKGMTRTTPSNPARVALSAGMTTAALLWVGSAQAASFFVQEQSVSGQGRSFAGSVAAAEDASTVWSNPAGMAFLPAPEVQFGVSALIPDSKITDDGSTIDYPGLGRFIPNLPPRPVGGSKGDNPYDTTFVPYNYIAAPVGAGGDLWLGLGITAPFGLAGEYHDDWFGRYDSTKSELRVFNISPVIAYRVNDWLSVGGGIDISYAEATLESSVPNPIGVLGLPDGKLKIKGDSLAVGFNLGVLAQPGPGTRIGVHFRSGIDHDLDGTGKLSGVTLPPNPLLPRSLDFSTDGTAELHLPPQASVGIRQRITPDITLLGSVTWYGWSSFEEIRVLRADGGDDLATAQSYHDTVAFAIGGEYQATDDLTLRTGFQYDPTPTRNGFRSSRTPDGDRYWLSAGLSYDVTETMTVDFAYSHVFIDSANIDASQSFYAGTPLQTDVAYRGKNSASVDIIAAALRYRF